MSSDEIDLADIDPLLGDDGADEPLSVGDLDDNTSANASSQSSPATASAPATRHGHAASAYQHHQQHQHHRSTSRQTASSPRPTATSAPYGGRASGRAGWKATSSSLSSRSVSAALPLLLSSSTATSLIKLSADSSSAAGLSYSLNALTASSSSRRSGASSQSLSRTATGSGGSKASSLPGSGGSASGQQQQQQLDGTDERRAEVHKPYFLRDGDFADGGVPAGSAGELMKLIQRQCEAETEDERYDFHYRLRRHAIALLAAQKSSQSLSSAVDVTRAPGANDASPSSPTASLSSLLLSFLSASSSSAAFLSSFERLLCSQSPFSLRLSPTEQRYYDGIVELLSSSAQPVEGRVVESLLRYWLGLGSMAHSLQAVNYLLAVHSASDSALTLSPSVSAFLHEWSSCLAEMRSPLLRLGRTKHLTAVPSCTRRVSLFTAASSSSSSFAHGSSGKSKRPHCGRKWDCEDDNGWERFDDRTSALLEAAYQQGRPHLDFMVEGKPHAYRADFQRMVQRNLQTGREKPLRTLLALLIREKSGRITQTVEINMPHSTSIRELRKELAQYLKHDEKQLRMMYANRVLRRVDYAHITIRDGIVPLGAEPLMVTKINKGDLEELCTFVLTGTEEVRQESWECLTCDFVDGRSFCAICAQVCHKGHVVRLLPSTAPSFCHCGAGAGGHEAPCQALEESPGDREPTHAPSMCVSACGQFVYTLSSDMGLVKLGTGGGEGDTCTGSLYAQNTLMCVHAGGCLVDVGGRLLLRSPMVREDVLLAIDPHTLLFTQERVVLGGRDESALDDSQAALARWLTGASTADDPAFLFSTSWTLEYNHNKLDVDDVEDAATTAKDSNSAAAAALAASSDEATWTALSPYFLLRIKQALLSNASYGALISSSAFPPSPLSPETACLSIEEEGLFLRLPCKLGMKRCRARIKHREHVMPVYVQEGGLVALNLVGLGEARSKRSRRQRQGAGAAINTGEQRMREEKEAREERKEDDEKLVSVTPVLEKTTRKKSRVQSIVVNSRVSGTDERMDRDREEKERERERERDSGERARLQSANIPPLIALAPHRKSRKRQQSLLLDMYALPSFPSTPSSLTPSSPPLVSLPVCSLCGHLPVSAPSSTSADYSSNPLLLSTAPVSSLVCPLCAHYSQPLGDSDSDLLIVLDDNAQKQLAELKEADRRKEDEERKRKVDAVAQQLAQLTVKGGGGGANLNVSSSRGAAAAVDSATDSGGHSGSSDALYGQPPVPINRQYADRLESLGFSALRVQKALVSTRSVGIEAALQWLVDNAEQPDIDAPWPKARLDSMQRSSALTDPSRPTATSASVFAFVHVSFLHCAHEACMPVQCIVDKYRAIKPISAQPAGKEASKASSAAAAAASIASVATCDGCGVSSVSSCGRSLRPLLMCAHRDCKDMFLCDHCALMGHWQHAPHHSSHSLERERSATQQQQLSTESDGARLTLGEFSVYLDSAHRQLAVIKQRESARRECVDLFDIAPALNSTGTGAGDDTARCVARDVFVSTHGDCFAYDATNGCVWAMSLSSGRLERWMAAPLVAPLSSLQAQSVTAATAAGSILHNLSCVATSPSVIAALLQRTFTALQTIFASTSLRNEQIAVDALVLLHSCLTRWEQHGTASTEQSHLVDAEQGTSDATSPVDVSALIGTIRVFLEQDVLLLSRLALLAPISPQSQSQTAAVTAKDAPLSDVSHLSALHRSIHSEACSVLVDGFEMFYPTWRQRINRIHSLLFTAATSPLSSHILRLLSAHYQSVHFGLLVSQPASAPLLADMSLLSAHTQHTLSLLLDDVTDADVDNVAASVAHFTRPADLSVGGKRSSQHVGTYVVLSYQSELLRLLAEVEGHLAAMYADSNSRNKRGDGLTSANSEHSAARRGSSSSPGEGADSDMSHDQQQVTELTRLQRRSKQINAAYIRLCHAGFVKAQLLLGRYEEEVARTAAVIHGVNTESAKAERAEKVLALFSQSSVGLLLPWLILSLPDLQVAKIQAADLSSLLSSVIALLCKLSSLSSAALSVTHPAVSPPSQQLRLTNIRAKIAQLRQSQQLLANTDLSSSTSATTAVSSSSSSSSSPSVSSSSALSSSGASASSTAHKRAKRKPSVMRLHPFAAEVFGLIFHEFATPSSFTVKGVPAMNKQNFCLYLKRKSNVTTEQTMSRTAAVFSKYGVPPVASFAEDESSGLPPSSSPAFATASAALTCSVFRISDVGNESSIFCWTAFSPTSRTWPWRACLAC